MRKKKNGRATPDNQKTCVAFSINFVTSNTTLFFTDT